MIARPIHRPHPISFTGPAPGAHSPRPVSWTASSGPARQVLASQRQHVAMAHHQATNEVSRITPAPQQKAPASASESPLNPMRCQPQVGTKPARTSGKATTPTELSARYIGHGALSVRSSVTGRHYRFQGHGDSQKIDKHDMLMLKRISDLIVS
ncbi:MAG: hypothetical protein HY836_18535 [Aquabacterium sp.]|uniref:hypothetical protein n=1 Tax=Aquabacterium sp. TaxID=1872578 RepID=UPI0025C5E822|nr:hypothetical protein [Aquabacterium sp.]MBI5927589.1 hypothetical protein [Aquabacterium sp.]